ncbi:MAG: tetraacyldisaccharide 4'-kinase [Desulfosarcina sp.]|nr:tetraacyldisaccharide 4'-kinase [Desulfosarcina sp.]MBC2743353.1 tetraacyldisaccharide 4'-kinase [Desulfosarcina sp.]MBC2766263.1 tetraacyldisaccharide 4'-kinase [Desulfosarcina sp.]
MCIRARLYEKGVLPSKTLPCRVVSIGNIIAGGTGKTPMTILVAQIIRDLGYRVVVISRGYRGRMEDKGGIVSDGETIFKGPEDAGDEPYLMARILKDIPIVVGRRRYEAGMMAMERFNPDVIVLDDAFQHIRLKRDINLVLLDSRSPLGNGYLLPRGLLREPVSALSRAHAVIFTRSKKNVISSNINGLPKLRPVFYTVHTPVVRKTDQGYGTFLNDVMDISILKGKKTVAFSGLADNDQFFDSLEQAGCNLDHKFSFADHYRYGPKDLDRIAETAKEKGAEVLVTTFKDFVKIENYTRWPVALVAVDVNIQLLGDKHCFLNFISGALKRPDA